MTSSAPKMLHPEQVSEPKPDDKPWLRQKHEPALWYMRFKRYLDMGPKRSLRKALADEPDTQKATKKIDKNQETKQLSDVSVPGAWKRASKVWSWVERAKSYDQAQIEKQAGFIRQVVTQQPFASKAYRIIQLCTVAAALEKYSKQGGMSLEECVTYTKTMQSLFRDIAHEMEGMDETTMMIADAYAHKHLVELANKKETRATTR